MSSSQSLNPPPSGGSGTECHRGKRILIAEDVRTISLTISRALEREGFESQVAADGEACLEQVASYQPDLIILDLMMPKMHGIEVLRTIRGKQETQELPVIVCSSRQFETDLRQVRELGAVDIVAKPFDCQELVAKVSQFFSHAPTPGSAEGEDFDAPLRAVEVGDRYQPTLAQGNLTLNLWGTRGSIPVCYPGMARHGGNTSSISVECGEEIIIFDAGSGIRELGISLLNSRTHTEIT